jgi:hypothetical protein
MKEMDKNSIKSYIPSSENLKDVDNGLIVGLNLNKINELSIRFDLKEKPDLWKGGHEINFNIGGTIIQAQHPLLIDSVQFGEGLAGPPLGHYWNLQSRIPIEFQASIDVKNFKNGHWIHIVSFLKENDYWDKIMGTIKIWVVENGNITQDKLILDNKELINDEYKINSFKVNW